MKNSPVRKPQTVFNILFCGRGGQGVLTAAEICGRAAILAGYHVKTSAVHGMAQRGGSVEAHLRFGKTVHSPLIPRGEVEWLVCFDKGEGDRHIHQLKNNGINFAHWLDDASSALNDPRTLNIHLLGILAADLPILKEHWISALRQVLPEKSHSANVAVFSSALTGKKLSER